MKAFNQHIRYLNIGKFVGVDQEQWQTAAKAGEKITKATADKNPSVAAQALANQTGGNIMGFTYE